MSIEQSFPVDLDSLVSSFKNMKVGEEEPAADRRASDGGGQDVLVKSEVSIKLDDLEVKDIVLYCHRFLS